MNTKQICEFLEWDSEFFGQRIARANVTLLSNELCTEITTWCNLQKIDCLYFLASSADQRTAQLAEDNMFRLVDVRVTLELQLDPGYCPSSPRFAARPAVEADIPMLRSLAGCSHRDSRFYYDGHFPDSLCDRLYETWIERSCRGWANRVIVIGEEARPEGYLTCQIPNPGSGKIGLLGVDEKARGKGLGRDLVSNAVYWFNQQGVRTISVVTQGRNVGAQRLYQRAGFLTHSVELWFHRWFPEAWKRQ